MPVLVHSYVRSRLSRLLGTVLAFFLAAPLFARGPDPALRIPLDTLGFQAQSTQFLLAGSSMITLHYVDNRHLLLTFGVHRLMERIADDPPDDEDRMMEAVLLEMPSGRVLARTDWRFHDNGQYLWELGHGRFLLRVRDTLTTFAPMANLASGQPFRQRPFLTSERRIGAVLLSPESDLLIVESVERTPPTPPPPKPLFGPTPKPVPAPLGRPGDPDPVALSFYRLSFPAGGDEVDATPAGAARSIAFGALPATAAGHLMIADEGRQEWAFDFHSYSGKVKELSPFGSTCRPRPQFVSGSEFVAFGCHSGNTAQVLGGFNMRGEEMWEQNLDGEFVAPSFVFAPSSGRFALGRVLGDLTAFDTFGTIPEGAFNSQNVVVYQMETGKQILHVNCSPIERAGQNFDLSPDGMELAVIRDGAIEIYSLPPLSAEDQADVKLARTLVPATDNASIIFSAPLTTPESAGPAPSDSSTPNASSAPVSAAAATSAATPATPKTASAPPPAAAPTPVAASKPAASDVPSGDAAPEQPRKPPTLYTLPTDSQNRESK